MIGKSAEEVLNRAVRYAFERQHEYFTLEHVLLSLLEETEILDAIQACGGSYTELKRELEEYLDKEVPKNSKKSDDDLPDADDEDVDEAGIVDHPVATLAIQRMIQRALFHVQSAGKDEILPEDLFVALFQSKDAYALHLLSKQKIQRLAVIDFFSHGAEVDTETDDQTEDKSESEKVDLKKDRADQRNKESLQAFTANLNDQAKKGMIDPLVGRKNELERVIQTLCRRRKNNPLLVGEAGVGKTALAEGLALRVVEGDVPKLLEKAEVYQLDLGSLLAGAKFRGDFEQRLKRVLKALDARKKKGAMPIMIIDEIHTIIGAGAVTGGVMDAANMLKPLLSRGELQCVGSTTYKEYRNVFEKDHALARRFQKIDVVEPNAEESVLILKGLQPKYEAHHGVEYQPEAIRAAVELSVKHLTDRHLPDKAIDVLDEVGARARLKKKGDEKIVITAHEVEEIIAKIARIPARSVSTSQKARLKNLERDLKLTIFGQDHAIRALVGAIRMARSGLRSGERPVGCFLFAGPTGVGKTELAKQLAHSMGVPFLRFDMSEYMEKHTVSRLIGAPPGYVGFDQAGLLTDAVLKNPHSVLLLDEFEKSHMDVWNILLQVMDNGVLTDSNGRKCDFKNSIIIMTSNVGSREHDRRPLGMSHSQKDFAQTSNREVERVFSPEFRNRLDSVVYFNPLDPVTIGQIVGKALLELESQLLAKSVEIEVTSEVREWLARKGYDPKMGARPMARLIERSIKRVLSDEILFGALESGGSVKIGLKSGELSFGYSAKKPDEKPQRKKKKKPATVTRK